MVDARTSEVGPALALLITVMHANVYGNRSSKNVHLFWGTFLESKNNIVAMWKVPLTFNVTTVSNEPLELDMWKLVWRWIMNLLAN
jgi:hypothetical protein